MNGLTIVKSLLVRVLLIAHGLVCAWRVVETNDNQYCWVILVGLGFLLVETGVVIWLRNGREFKTVSFCIIFYLTCSMPSLWIIHVETANRKLYRLAENKLSARAALPANDHRHLERFANNSPSSYNAADLKRVLPATTPLILSIRHIECYDKAWYYMEEQQWLDIIQETLLVVLCVSRLLISYEHLTVEKSGVILVVTLMNIADLLSVSHSLQYHDVIIERLYMYIGLVLLTIGLFQMAFIDTDGLIPSSIDLTSLYNSRRSIRATSFFHDETLFPLFRALFIHDGIFLLYRILLATKVRCSFHCYRVYRVAQMRQRKRAFDAYEQLINTPTSAPHYRYPPFRFDRSSASKKEERLLHHTVHRAASIAHRRIARLRALYNYTPQSISYPFVRRRNDGGRARTAFALYGLPFRTPQLPQTSTNSSSSSLVAKAFVH